MPRFARVRTRGPSSRSRMISLRRPSQFFCRDVGEVVVVKGNGVDQGVTCKGSSTEVGWPTGGLVDWLVGSWRSI